MVVWTWLATNWFSLLQTVSIVTGLAVVAKQQRQSRLQRELDSLARVLDTNRQLRNIGFSHPELLDALNDAKPLTTEAEKSYLQEWLNHFSLAYSYIKNAVFRGEQAENLERGIRASMQGKNMQEHWATEAQFYTTSFQIYINAMLKKNEPPAAAHQDTD